jgi:hypothetical protein
MKKLVIGITIVTFVIISSTAMAATPKVPKNLCYTYSGGYYHHQLLLKSMGTIQTSDGKVKMYTVIGNSWPGLNCPIHGTGYVTPGTTTFHATFNTMCGSATYTVTSYELWWDLETNTGDLYRRYDRSAGDIDTYTESVPLADCNTFSIE